MGNYRKAVTGLNEAAQQGSSAAQLQAASLFKYSCTQILEENAAGASDALGNAGMLADVMALIEEYFGETELEASIFDAAVRWVDAAVNFINGVLQSPAIDHTSVVSRLRLDPMCSRRAIEHLERAADQEELVAAVELGDLLYDTGTGGGIGGYYAMDPAIRDDPEKQASLQLAAQYYRRAISGSSKSARVRRSQQRLFEGL